MDFSEEFLAGAVLKCRDGNFFAAVRTAGIALAGEVADAAAGVMQTTVAAPPQEWEQNLHLTTYPSWGTVSRD